MRYNSQKIRRFRNRFLLFAVLVSTFSLTVSPAEAKFIGSTTQVLGTQSSPDGSQCFTVSVRTNYFFWMVTSSTVTYEPVSC